MRKRLFLLSISFLVSVSFVAAVFAGLHIQEASAQAYPGSQILLGPVAIPAYPDSSIHATEAITYFIYVPTISLRWIPPCGVMPFLVSPPDGGTATSDDNFVLDGGFRGGSYDWLAAEFSRTANFANSKIYYLQPAGKLWELNIGSHNLDPGQWYWRASVWCNGPGWPPPPDNYEQSPYSEVWDFTVK